jgi:predicted phosphodiesterase
MATRHTILPAHGHALVSTDIHGNHDDFLALRRAFEALGPDAHWVILGDVVHGPDDTARAGKPELYGYPDESFRIVDDILALERACPGRVHFVLGNHDHGHVGGPHTHKFWPDEVAHLEASLSPAQRDAMRELFSRALLAVAAPCGVFLSHGSPDDTLERLDDLDRVEDLARIPDPRLAASVHSFLTHYGQPDAKCARFLERMSASSGLPLRVVVHGHDRIETGFFYEGQRQVCLCIFGAPREAKRCLVLDLAARYERAADLRDGVEIRRLHT